ncbi:MAG: hypothetical protein QM724_03645 [Flavobacteriales bacterium]
MRTLFSLTAAAALCGTISAQDVITRVSGGQSYFYYDPGPSVADGERLQAIIGLASAGDTLYLGGDNYVLDYEHPIHQNKRLVIVGTGWHQDSTTTSGRTRISRVQGPTWWLDRGADGSEFHGLFFDDVPVAINGYEANSAIDGLRFVRCQFSSLALGTQTGTSWATNITVEQCVIGSFDFHDVATATVKNSVITGTISRAVQGSLVENCLLLNPVLNNASGSNGLTYKSCVFTRKTTAGETFTVNVPAIFLNNRWVLEGAGSSLAFGANVISQSGNAAVTGLGAAFANTANIDYTAFNEDANYAVVPAFLTAGYGGTQVGIYGGPGPAWKNGALPFNPHWRLLTSPGSTATNGVLSPVTIKASAQTR